MRQYRTIISSNIFPLAEKYLGLKKIQVGLVCEAATSRIQPFKWTERHLQAVWYDEKLRPPELISQQGEKVRIESPGVWNLESGPDFLGAALIVGSERLVAGDVEIHIHPKDWKTHGHHKNPAFNNVRIHATYFPGTVSPKLFPPGVIHLPLKNSLHSNPRFSFDVIDVAQYPFATRSASPPCRASLKNWSFAEKGKLLDAAGEERMRRKSLRIAHSLLDKSAEQVFYEESMSALGYKHNKAAFRHLAEELPIDELRQQANNKPETGYALLMGISGLLPTRPRTGWDKLTTEFNRRLWDEWWKRQETFEARIMPRSEWRFSGQRPVNNPARRMMSAAQLFCGSKTLMKQIINLAEKQPAIFVKNATALLANVTDAYWKNRLSFGGKLSKNDIALIGTTRGGEIVTNVFIPFLAAMDIKKPFESGCLQKIASGEDNAITRQVAHDLFGPDHSPKIYRSGLRRQGLLQIFHDFCLNDRSRCAACQFPQMLLENLDR